MRRIETKEQINKRKKRNQVLVGGVLVFLLTFAAIGYAIMMRQSEDLGFERTNEKGFNFYRVGDFWQLNIEGQSFYFENLPSEVEHLTYEIDLDLSMYSSKALYSVNATPKVSNILSNIGPYILRYQEACLMGTNCTKDLPYKDCSENILIFNVEEDEKIEVVGNCVYLSGTSSRIADAFVYEVLNIN